MILKINTPNMVNHTEPQALIFVTEPAKGEQMRQILQQAGTAMLAQANALPNSVLSLLRG